VLVRYADHNPVTILDLGTLEMSAISNVTDLGVDIDDRLTFATHINHLVAKARIRAKFS
jgi:hypothetical protein